MDTVQYREKQTTDRYNWLQAIGCKSKKHALLIKTVRKFYFNKLWIPLVQRYKRNSFFNKLIIFFAESCACIQIRIVMASKQDNQ
jgi:hypothetical protein